jgi:hypothetical protein
MRARALLLVLLVWSPLVLAQKKPPPPPEGVAHLGTLHPDKGFVDDPFAFDSEGRRLALVRADAADYAEVEVLDLADGGNKLARFDLAPVTTSPISLRFVDGGTHLLVVGRPPGEGKATAYLVSLAGKVVRKWGPAADLSYVELGGTEAVSVFDAKAHDKGGGTTYEVSVFALKTGKAMGKKRAFVTDGGGFVQALNMTIQYWRKGYTELVGRRAGAYDKSKDLRMNDGEAVFDVVAGVLGPDRGIADVIAYARTLTLRRVRNNQAAFAHVPSDLSGVELLLENDQRVAIPMDEPFSHYDAKSLHSELGRDGKVYFTLTIDPVNADAVERKIADPELVDLYAFDPATPTGKALRLARVPKGDRPFSWRFHGKYFVVLRKHKGFDRGGADLDLYEVLAK